MLLAAVVAQTPQPSLSAGGDSLLSVRPLYAAAGAAVNVVYNRPGSDGCYRQSGVTTAVNGNQVTHDYRIWAEGEICTEALVRGGFTTSYVPPKPGTYEGLVRINGNIASRYALRVFATPQAAERAMLADAAAFDDWTLQQILGAITPEQKGLAKALVPRVRKVLAEQVASPTWYAVLQFLGSTLHLDLIRAVKPELAATPEPSSSAYAYHKWTVLTRIASDKELAAKIEETACTQGGAADGIFTAAKEQNKPGLCVPIRKAAQRIRKECNHWHNGYAALLSTPACGKEVVTLLNDDPPDYSFLAQIESLAGHAPYRQVIRHRLPAWRKGLTGEYAESYRQILQRLENAVK